MEAPQIIEQAKKGQFAPIYLLHGEESYFTDLIENAILDHALNEAEKAFNLTVAYGKDTDPQALMDALRRYPMMAPRQVVVLREAQEMSGIEALLAYVEHPVDTSLLVLCYKHGRLNLTTKLGRALKEKAVIHEGKPLYDNQMPDWVVQYLRGKGLKIEMPQALLLAEHIGTQLTRAANELDKLAINVPYGSTVTGREIEQYIGLSKEYNTFELCKAFAERDTAKVARIRDYFTANIRKHHIIPVISALYAYFSKVYMLHGLSGQSDGVQVKTLGLRSEWFLKEYRSAARNYPPAKTEEIIGLLAEYDLKAKGVDYNSSTMGDEGLMRELFARILH